MTVAAQFQDMIFQGGNAFFRVQKESIHNDYYKIEEVEEDSHTNRMEKGIVQIDKALMSFVDIIVLFLETVFAKKHAIAATVPVNSTDKAFSSSKRLVEKFNAQYAAINSESAKNTKSKRKRKRKSPKDYIELALGIVIYAVYKGIKKLT